ncbi:Serine/threonine-protein kinase ulk3 [Marasmius tenuissimus]|uniref:Serine/threonine-protein kinase ulk3 n=1 Tax=Marasmius tenuissimus TaxID=585030 RepID=A0ABR3A3V4_9AGAR
MKLISQTLQTAKNCRGSISTAPASPHLAVRPGQILDSRFQIIKQLGSDIKPDNILLSTASNEEFDLDTINEAGIVLVDFGTAIPPSGPHSRLIQPTAFRSPEVITGCVWDSKVDIWNLGCIVFELITGQHLFKPRASAIWSAE